MQLTKEQLEFLDRVVKVGTWVINSEGKIDVDGRVDMSKMNLTQIPVKFGKVSGWFDCSENNLTSLEGCPDYVGGDFYCYDNNLTSLKGSPIEVVGDFRCYQNLLTSLEFAPSEVGGVFWCHNNNLTSLEGCPNELGGYFYCFGNNLKNYFKNIKEEDFKLWGNLNWWDIIEEYPFLINICKKYITKNYFIELIEHFPKTKLYLK